MPFSPETLDFLFENWSRNDRNWYHENKNRFKTCVQEPFIAFTHAIAPVMLEIDPLMDCSEKRISRVYRDARVIGNGPFFRDHIWCTAGRGRDNYFGFPCFYFELSPRGYNYGMGYYVPAPETVEAIRSLILAEDKAFLKAFKAHRKQKVFNLEGELYKRDHFPDAPEAYKGWLNRKGFSWNCHSEDFDTLFSSDLPGIITKDFQSIAPIYHFLLKAESSWRESQA